jgi:hypothetical protein
MVKEDHRGWMVLLDIDSAAAHRQEIDGTSRGHAYACLPVFEHLLCLLPTDLLFIVVE